MGGLRQLVLQLSGTGGHIALPVFSMYHATKWGIEGFYESLANCSACGAGARRR